MCASHLDSLNFVKIQQQAKRVIFLHFIALFVKLDPHKPCCLSHHCELVVEQSLYVNLCDPK